MFVTNVKDVEWSSNENYAPLRWKLLVDSKVVLSSGISCGILEIPAQSSLELHNHLPQEIYLIRSGEGLLLKKDGEERIIENTVIYIHKEEPHGLKNTGNCPLEVLWIFPTNCWEEVKYNFYT
tara:strand:+ start:1754 stop:2122 length:369 start_codon:yes stop_codon:yes gene_type:complete